MTRCFRACLLNTTAALALSTTFQRERETSAIPCLSPRSSKSVYIQLATFPVHHNSVCVCVCTRACVCTCTIVKHYILKGKTHFDLIFGPSAWWNQPMQKYTLAVGVPVWLTRLWAKGTCAQLTLTNSTRIERSPGSSVFLCVTRFCCAAWMVWNSICRPRWPWTFSILSSLPHNFWVGHRTRHVGQYLLSFFGT